MQGASLTDPNIVCSILEMNRAGSISDIVAQTMCCQSNSRLLGDLVNKRLDVEAAAIFSHL